MAKLIQNVIPAIQIMVFFCAAMGLSTFRVQLSTCDYLINTIFAIR